MDSQDDASLGRVVGDRYRIVARRGGGTLGAVYDAVHTTTDKKIILEVLDAEVVDREVVSKNFLRSMRQISRLRHRSMAAIDGFGQTPDGDLYVAVDRHRSSSLSEVLEREGALRWGRVRAMLSSIIEALTVAHRRSVLHGGLRPEVIFIAEGAGGNDEVRVADFGMHDIAAAARFAANTRGATTRLVGDPRYMALEQFVSGEASVAADIYGLGAVLYHALTGQPPHEGVNAFHALLRNQEGEVAPVATLEPSVPPEVEAIVMKALARDPEDRFADLKELEQALRRAPSRELEVVAASERAHAEPENPEASSPKSSIGLVEFQRPTPPPVRTTPPSETPPVQAAPPVEAPPTPATPTPTTKPVLLLGATLGSTSGGSNTSDPIGEDEEEERTVVLVSTRPPRGRNKPRQSLEMSVLPPSFDETPPTQILSKTGLEVPEPEPQPESAPPPSEPDPDDLDGHTEIAIPIPDLTHVTSTRTDPMLGVSSALPVSPAPTRRATLPAFAMADVPAAQSSEGPATSTFALSRRSVYVVIMVLFAVGIVAGYVVEQTLASGNDADRTDNTQQFPGAAQ